MFDYQRLLVLIFFFMANQRLGKGNKMVRMEY